MRVAFNKERGVSSATVSTVVLPLCHSAQCSPSATDFPFISSHLIILSDCRSRLENLIKLSFFLQQLSPMFGLCTMQPPLSNVSGFISSPLFLERLHFLYSCESLLRKRRRTRRKLDMAAREAKTSCLTVCVLFRRHYKHATSRITGNVVITVNKAEEGEE